MVCLALNSARSKIRNIQGFFVVAFFGAEQVVLYGKAAVVIRLRIATVFVLPYLEVIAYVPVLA